MKQLLVMLSVLPCIVAGENWPQFRGFRAAGVDASAPAPVRWSIESGENIAWRAPIPGLAHSSPIIWNDRIYAATADRPGKADLDRKSTRLNSSHGYIS